jgi:integrase
MMLAAWCQLRRGEVLGLQRGDIDLVNGTVKVERAEIGRAYTQLIRSGL